MATYYDIFGQKVQYLSSDPANLTKGQVWYNSTSNTAKFQGATTSGTWATGGSLNTARNSINPSASIGTQTAGVAAGGFTGTARTNNTEEYNGLAWTTVNPMNNTLSSRGTAGTQTAGLASGGLPNPVAVANSEEYNGTSWANGNAMNNARGYGFVSTGTQDAAMAAGGYHPPVTFVTAVEFYDGTCWTNQPGTIQPNYAGGSAGSQISAWYVGAGGVATPGNKLAYNWDGTSWTASNPYNDTSKVNFFSAGPPTGTTGYIAGGDYDPGLSNKTEEYDGTSWTNSPATLNTTRSVGGNCGDLSAGLAVGGYNGTARTGVTEEWTGAGVPETKTITTT